MHGTILNGHFLPDCEHYLSEKVTKEDLKFLFAHPLYYDAGVYGDLPVQMIYRHLTTEESTAVLEKVGHTIVSVYYRNAPDEILEEVYALWNKKLGANIIGKPLEPLDDPTTESPKASEVATESRQSEAKQSELAPDGSDETEETDETGKEDKTETKEPSKAPGGRRKTTSANEGA